MNGRSDERRERRMNEAAAQLGHTKIAAEQRLCRSRAEADEHFRPDERDLGIEPRLAGADLHRIGLPMDAALAARRPFEMLHHVGDISLAPRDAGLSQATVEQLA